MKRERIETVRDAREANLLAKSYERDARIGELCRNGRQVFYAYVGGIYREGSIADLCRMLEANDAR